jgi:NADH dehydrogenase [ubiquinone] 1 alpha subcomplex assembly factor 5
MPDAAIARIVTDAPPHDLPFDRMLRRMRRDRAAATGGTDWLRRRMADDILERLDLVTRPFERALDLGCADLYLTTRLRARGLDVVAADAGPRWAKMADGVCCDEDRLPFAEGSFDLIVSAGALDTVNDLPGALVQIRRALRPDGLFLGAFVGAGSLPRLKTAMLAADEAEGAPASAHVHPQIDVRAAGDLLGRAGFALPVVDSERLTVRYSSLDRLVADLRAMGATNMLAARARRPLGRIGRVAAIASFQAEAEADGKTAERFEILHLVGWAPSPDQPRPARRGSAATSLADALKRSTT